MASGCYRCLERYFDLALAAPVRIPSLERSPTRRVCVLYY